MKTRTKIFFILLIAVLISTILVLPYVLEAQGELLKNSPVSMPILILVAIIQAVVVLGIATLLGVILAEKTGFKIPVLTAWIEKKKIKYKRILLISVIWGVIAGILILVLDILVFKQIVVINASWWQGLLASFYGGIAEEVLMRLFLVSLFVFIFMKVFRKKIANPVMIWVSIIIVSVLFGLGHLPITSALVSITPIVIIRAIVLNGVGGIIFGWLYWKKGLEAAMISHFSADIVLHVLAPLIL